MSTPLSSFQSTRKMKAVSFLRYAMMTALILSLTVGFYGCSQETPFDSQSQSQDNQDKQNIVDPIPGQYVVVLKSTRFIGNIGASKVTPQEISTFATDAGVKAEKVYTTVLNGFSAELSKAQHEALMNDPAVDYIEPDYPIHMIAQTVPWGITAVKAQVAHARGTKGATVKVGVIDTGIDHGHADLSANYAGGIDFVNNDNDPLDDNGHGSHVSGTIGAVDNTIGVLGVAPSVQLYGIKVLDANGSGTFSNVIAGIDWAAANGMNVVNMSLGASIGTNGLQTACDNAFAAGVVICAAAGNDFGGPVGFPAKYTSAIAVSAVDQNNNLANFSNKGPEVEVTAPGVGVFSTYKNGQFATLSGTSMATPHAAGVAALIWSTGQFTTATAVRNQLTSTATDIGATGRDNNFGFGLVNADAATNVGGPVNQAPTANANGPYSGVAGNAVSFSSAGSSDPDGTIAGYIWDFGDGATSTTASPSHTYSTAGTFNVSLTVTDDLGATGSNGTTATISAPPNNNPPVADFSGSPTSGSAPLSVNFSDLSTNGPTSWAWDFGDGGTSASQNPSYVYNNAGTFTVSLTATNANGSNTMTKTGYIVASTPPPAGEGFILSRNADFSTDDRAFTTGETMYMKIWSNVVDFNNLKKETWELKDANKKKIKQNLTNNNDGTWTAAFALSGLPSSSTNWTWKGDVSDNAKRSFKPTTSVTVTPGGGGNQAPSANPNGPYSATLGNAINFSSAGSSDPDGTIVGYSWDFGDGNTSTAANPSHTYGAAGNYTVSLTVTDDQGATGSATTSASVTAPPTNQSPNANANGPYSATLGNAINFSSAGSSDPDGTIVGYSWDFGDGNTSTTANPAYTYGAAGNYTVSLTVTDDQGATGSASTSASVTAPPTNQAPNANANGPYSGTTGNAVSFSSAGSSDPDGTIVGYSWDFGDGNTSTTANPNHTYGAAGNYTVSLTVTDDQGATGSANTSANITAGGGGGADNITILKAEYRVSKGELKVRASSDDPNATLSVVGFGQMKFNSKKGYWELKVKLGSAPSTVTVTSDLGGSATANVTLR